MTEQKVPYPSLDTPAVPVDMDILEANIREMSQLATEAGVRLRPHCKIHESASIAKLQIEAEAYAVEVDPIRQAEAMADEGINNILVVHPGFYGGPKEKYSRSLLLNQGLSSLL